MMRLGAGAAGSKAGAGGLQLAPTIGTFQPNEVLGHPLSADVRQQLNAAQKYRIEAGHTESVTRLVLPDYLSVTDELAKLQARFPDQLFGLNYRYASYRGAGESSGEPLLPAGKGHGCDAARCYGSAMIGWHPDLTTCARNVVVGIIDTGLDAKHPALKGLHLIQHPEDALRRGDNWHGTGVAALLAGARESSTPGLIPEAQYVVVDAFFASGTEETNAGAKPDDRQTITDTDHLLWALEMLQQKRTEVVNMSLVGPSDPAIHAEIRKMARSGVVFVAAAGNGGPAGVPAYPAAYPEVIAVTAVGRNRLGYVEANHGAYIDVAAPGVRVWTALPGERQGFLSGTSFAAPFVTAIAAATYNSTPMKAAARGQEHPFNPKGEVIGRMAVEKLGAGGLGTRDGVFGLGLARAPETCAPPMASPVAEAPTPQVSNPEALTSGGAAWQTLVHHVSSTP
jgi:subtilisin family serine protease